MEPVPPPLIAFCVLALLSLVALTAMLVAMAFRQGRIDMMRYQTHLGEQYLEARRAGKPEVAAIYRKVLEERGWWV